jgi:signal peptidase I
MPTLSTHVRSGLRHRRPAITWRKLVRHAGTAVVLAGFAAWFVLLRPQYLGGPATYVMVSGTSMEPTLKTGDFIVARRPDAYKRGDIVAYRLPENEVGAGAIVIHRIVGGDAKHGFIIKGDNKKGPDLWRPTQHDLHGTAWIRIPHAGIVIQRLHAPVPLAFFAGLLTFLLIVPWPKLRRRSGK